MVTENRSASGGVEQGESFGLAFKWIWIFGVWNVVVLIAVIASAMTGGGTSTFMWVRAVILLAVALFLLWLAAQAGRGSVSAAGRLRIVSTVLPIAVVVVDIIPGVAPTWYAALQGAGALALVPVAIIAWREWQRDVAAHRFDHR